jgi:hypothetical protein
MYIFFSFLSSLLCDAAEQQDELVSFLGVRDLIHEMAIDEMVVVMIDAFTSETETMK